MIWISFPDEYPIVTTPYFSWVFSVLWYPVDSISDTALLYFLLESRFPKCVDYKGPSPLSYLLHFDLVSVLTLSSHLTVELVLLENHVFCRHNIFQGLTLKYKKVIGEIQLQLQQLLKKSISLLVFLSNKVINFFIFFVHILFVSF